MDGRGVLHLVDEQMAKLHAESFVQVEHAAVLPERASCLQRELGEIALSALGEDQLQLHQHAAQKTEECLGHFPLFFGILCRGQLVYAQHGLQ